MNPIFSRNPMQALAVARALGAVQGPENAPEERMRVLLGLASTRMRVVSVEDTARALFPAGLRVGPLFLGTVFATFTGLHDLKSAPRVYLETGAGAHGHIFTALPRKEGPRAEKRRERAMAALRLLTGNLVKQDPHNFLHRDFTHFARPNKIYDAYTTTRPSLHLPSDSHADLILRAAFDALGGKEAAMEQAAIAVRDFARRVIRKEGKR